MSFDEVLRQKKDNILNAWFQVIIETYPPETARFLKKEKNPFANPVGRSIHEGIAGLLDDVLQGVDRGVDVEKVSPFLDKIIRIRAIQDFTPADAVAFVFSLKHVVRERLQSDLEGKGISLQDLMQFESKVDELALLAFNVFMACREKLCEIRVEEVKNRTYRLLQRANLLDENLGQESGIKNGKNDNQT